LQGNIVPEVVHRMPNLLDADGEAFQVANTLEWSDANIPASITRGWVVASSKREQRESWR